MSDSDGGRLFDGVSEDDLEEPVTDSGKNEKQVQDGEGYVERRIKERITDARDRVAEHKSKLLVEFQAEDALTNPRSGPSLQQTELLQLWAGTVKQYLRAIEPLLRDGEIPNAGHYYNEIEIVDEVVYPPDDRRHEDAKTRVSAPDGSVRAETIPWGQFYKSEHPARGSDLLERGFEPPEPKQVTLKGLKSIMETDKIVREWAVPLNPHEPSFRQAVAYPRQELPLQKEWLETAVAEADQFLHDSGLGLNIDSGDPYDET